MQTALGWNECRQCWAGIGASSTVARTGTGNTKSELVQDSTTAVICLGQHQARFDAGNTGAVIGAEQHWARNGVG